MSRDQLERQKAFTGLLADPVLDRHSRPELWPLVRRHRSVLSEWFDSRLGYRLVVTDVAARLFRLPLDGTVVAPRRFQPPPRRVLVLALLAAAAAEDAEDVTTTQDLSDRVRVIAAHDDVSLAPYEPDRFAERLLFVKAIGLLVSVGALLPTGHGDEERREGWAHRTDKIGGAYEVRRELLLRMVDPTALRAAVGEAGAARAAHESAARHGLMRRLLELPVCLFADLSGAERVYLTGQRHRVLAWCGEMTGWVPEQRAEGIALVATEESATDLPFPRLRATDFASLMVLDELLRAKASLIDDGTLTRAAAEVRQRHSRAMTNELKADGAIERIAVETLAALDLLRPAGQPGLWRLTAVAARFRNPTVISVTAQLDRQDGKHGEVDR